jgi:hypothetical protein
MCITKRGLFLNGISLNLSCTSNNLGSKLDYSLYFKEHPLAFLLNLKDLILVASKMEFKSYSLLDRLFIF